MVCGQLLRRQGRTKIHIPLAYDRQRKRANLRRQPMVAGFAAALRQQTRGAVLAQAVQQPKYLTPAQADQRTRVGNTHSTRLNLQQYLKPAEILLAHRPRRHGTPPETPRSGEVPFELWRGVSSLYGAYRHCRRKGSGKSAVAGSTVSLWPSVSGVNPHDSPHL